MWPGTVREPRGRGTSAVRRHYRVTAIKDVTVDTVIYMCVCVCVCERERERESESESERESESASVCVCVCVCVCKI
jgi:hypothetical protein